MKYGLTNESYDTPLSQLGHFEAICLEQIHRY